MVERNHLAARRRLVRLALQRAVLDPHDDAARDEQYGDGDEVAAAFAQIVTPAHASSGFQNAAFTMIDMARILFRPHSPFAISPPAEKLPTPSQ
jgi:hypothetical protein